ncbi:MAG TPA: PIN domain-containing protein [Candidatus Acidoferrum sp.]|nr:PIN domain-containing protein [Candidatus Acidoferrum sp.]
MRYLLDVNTLLALVVLDHEFHARVAIWVERLGAGGVPELATCSITELGFVRVLGQAQQYGSSIAQARELLLRVKNSKGMRWIFIPDDRDISRLPRWVRTPKQTTDGHLAELARANQAILATLDRRIPGAFFIPQSPRS